MKTKTVAIIQARIRSTRLPGKVLSEIAGHPMLWHVVNRIKQAKSISQIVVATSVELADDTIASFCDQNRIDCFRGSESDVLDRYYQAARDAKADNIVRITADCPLIDPKVIDKVVETFLEGGFDYATNTFKYTYPDGLDTEAFSFQALETSWHEAKLPAEREHVTPFMRNSARFRVKGIENEINLAALNLRWTVDEPQDLEFIRAIFSHFSGKKEFFLMEDILNLIKAEPSIEKINRGLIRNEGYYISLAQEPPIPPVKNRTIAKSISLRARAEKLIPSCSQTFSKGPTQYVQGVAPVFLARGEGSRVWDVDGNEYIDYPLALGPIILGHNYPAVSEAVTRQMKDGVSFSLPHPLEIEVSELLTEIIPCAEMVRFGKNGSDATAGAVRVARAATGRDLIACCGYHGWQDWYIGTTTRNKGVPKAVQEMTLPFAYNDIVSLQKIFSEHPGEIAAVIMEPMGVIEPKDHFLQRVKELAHREGTILIFDEIVTGFRLSLGGAQEYFGVVPDLACFGKAMGNGYPIAAVVGRRDLMAYFDEVFFSFTFGGETLSLAASKATITEMRNKNVIGHLWEQGQKLKDGYNVLAKTFGLEQMTECTGLAPRSLITFKDERGADSILYRSLFQQECLKRGVLFAGGQNICYSHGNAEIEQTLRAYRTAMEIVTEAVKAGDVSGRLEGEPVQSVFRRP